MSRGASSPRLSARLALAAVAVACAAGAAAQGRLVHAMGRVGPEEGAHVAPCPGGRDGCTTRWSGTSPSGAIVAEVASASEDAEGGSALWLLVERRGERFRYLLGESGRFCGGAREGSRITSFQAAELVDFHGGPEPELFVDVRDSVWGGETHVSQIGSTVCSLEARTPSCHEYVGGSSAPASRTFPTRDRVVVGATEIVVPFLP